MKKLILALSLLVLSLYSMGNSEKINDPEKKLPSNLHF